jgi:2-keto-myo-inositol isomerase
MQSHGLSRRDALARAGLAAGAALTGLHASKSTAAPDTSAPAGGSFVLCFNTGTIRGQKLGVAKEMDLAAQAGFQAIEPWVEHIDQYAKSGGSLKDLKKRASDSGLTVESAITFPEWVVDDDARRAAGLERAKRDMDLVAQIGGKRLACPPAGATGDPRLDLMKITERYRALLEVGDTMGVVPELELWGFSKNVRLLSEAAFVAIQTGHPKACVLADVFHLYKGDSDFAGLRLLSAGALQVFHMNDYPADPPRDKTNDSYRLFPGDGVAPLTQILRDLRASGGTTVLSLELFSKKYWEMDAGQVARDGFQKLKAAVARAQ